jgi:hypothetical protein
MPMTDSDFIRCNIRVPQELYEKIEKIAIANGAKINSRSKRPQIGSTLIELLRIGLEQYAQVNQSTTEVTEAEDLNTQILAQQAQQLERLNQRVENQQQFQQTIEQYLTQIQTSQQLTQVDINHLYQLMGQLCVGVASPVENQLRTSTVTQTASNSPPQLIGDQLIGDQPLAASLDQWTVNRQWLSVNGCFCEETFEQWQNGEVRQDQQGRAWRRVELTNVLAGFEIPSDLASSQIFYVLEHHH